MNARLKAFLDQFGFSYTFKSGSEEYRKGHAERGAAARCSSGTTDPRGGACRRSGRSGVPPIARSCRSRRRPAACCRYRLRSAAPTQGTVVFRDEDGTLTEVPVTDGHCKMQWKCDWALRWAALDVDYEMSGKDLINSVKLSTRICRS